MAESELIKKLTEEWFRPGPKDYKPPAQIKVDKLIPSKMKEAVRRILKMSPEKRQVGQQKFQKQQKLKLARQKGGRIGGRRVKTEIDTRKMLSEHSKRGKREEIVKFLSGVKKSLGGQTLRAPLLFMIMSPEIKRQLEKRTFGRKIPQM